LILSIFLEGDRAQPPTYPSLQIPPYHFQRKFEGPWGKLRKGISYPTKGKVYDYTSNVYTRNGLTMSGFFDVHVKIELLYSIMFGIT